MDHRCRSELRVIGYLLSPHINILHRKHNSTIVEHPVWFRLRRVGKLKVDQPPESGVGESSEKVAELHQEVKYLARPRLRPTGFVLVQSEMEFPAVVVSELGLVRVPVA